MATEAESYEDVYFDEAPAAPVNALALQPSRLPMSPSIAKEFDIDAPTWRVLVEQTFPSARTIEAVLMALSYCRARNLDIFKKPVHIVPMWSSTKRAMVETVWPGIAEIRTTAARTGEYVGIDAVEFGPMVDRTFKGKLEVWENRKKVTKDVEKTVRYPEWASVTVYRLTKGHRYAYHAKVFWEETYAKMGRTEIPNEMWEKRARGQLDKCVEAAALRKAFPEEVGSMYAAEEMEGRVIEGAVVPEKPAPTALPEVPADEPEAKGTDAIKSETKPDLSTAAADDFNDDATGLTTDPVTISGPAPNMDVYFQRIEEEVAGDETEEAFLAHWQELGVEVALVGNEAALDRAEIIRRQHLARVQKDDRAALVEAGQGDIFGDLPVVPE